MPPRIQGTRAPTQASFTHWSTLAGRSMPDTTRSTPSSRPATSPGPSTRRSTVATSIRESNARIQSAARRTFEAPMWDSL